MIQKDNSTTVFSNFFWRLLERFGAQSVTLIVNIILARILDPSVYGTIALIMVITTILQVFVDSGLATSLIQKKDADIVDFSTVFWANIVACLFLYAFLFFSSPVIANYYLIPELKTLIRVLGVIIIISGFKNIQNAYVSRNLMFKKYFFATLGGTVSAAIVGVILAYNGFGIWALVFQNIINQLIDTVILWLTVKWRPTKQFSFARLKILFSYGWKLLLSALLDTTWTQLRQLIIGKKYSTNDLAFYNKGNEYPYYATLALNSSIDSVLLPVMSKSQDEPERIKQMTRRAIKTSSFLLWPLMLGLAACSKPFISLLLTDKWLFSAPYLVIFCIVYAFYPIHTANLNAIKAMGRSDVFLKLEILKKLIGFFIIIISVQFGVIYIASFTILESIVAQLINSWPNQKLLHYSYKEQIIDIIPYILISSVMAAIVYSITFLDLSSLLTLIIQVPLGVFTYIFLSYIFKIDSFSYCIDVVKKMKKR